MEGNKRCYLAILEIFNLYENEKFTLANLKTHIKKCGYSRFFEKDKKGSIKLTKFLNELEKKGYIKHEYGNNKRRYYITKEGKSFYEQLKLQDF